MAKKFALAIEIGALVKESFKSAVGQSKRDLKAIQRLANIKIGASIKANKQKLKKQLSSWKSIAGTALSMSAPVMVGASFEFQMKRVKALANATTEEFAKLEAKARELGATTQYSASEVGKAMEYLSMAGFKVGQTLKATEGVLNLATVGNIDLGTSADIASNILSGFGMKADEINRVVDVMAKTITSSNTSVVELGETMKYVAPFASKLGASVEEVSAMAGLLANIGIKGSQAGTSLRAMFLRLSAPTGEAQRALAMLGVRVQDSEGKIRPMAEILADLHRKLKGIGSEKMRMQLLKQIFGEEPIAGLSELLEKAGTGELQKYIQEIKNAKGSAKKMVEEMNDTVMMKWKSVLSAVEGIFLTIYKPLEPIIKFTLDVVVGGLRILNKVLEFTAPVLAPVVFGFGSLFIVSKLVAIGTTIIKLGLLNVAKAMFTAHISSLRLITSMIGLRGQSVLTGATLNSLSFSVGGFWGKVKSVINSTLSFSKKAFVSIITGAKTVGIALLTNPVFWIGAAIAGIGYLIVSNWQSVKKFFSGLWAGFKEGFKPVFDALSNLKVVFKPVINLFSKVKNTFAGLKADGESFYSVGVLIGKAISLAFTPIVLVAKAVNWIIDKVSNTNFSPVKDSLIVAFSPLLMAGKAIGWIINKISSIDFSSLVSSVKNTFAGVSNFIGGVLKAGFDIGFSALKTLGSAVKDAFLAPIKLVEGLVNKIKAFFSALKDNPVGKVLSFGKNIVGSVVSKTTTFFKSIFTSKEEKQKETIRESSTYKAVEKETKLEKVGKEGISINNLIGSFSITINTNSKEVIKEIENRYEDLKEIIVSIVEDALEEKERQLKLYMGR